MIWLSLGSMSNRKKVGSLHAEEERVFLMIVDILDIKHELHMQQELIRWIQKDGLDHVFETVIRLYTTYSME